MPTLIIFSGLTGVGKSTLAQAICRETGAAYVHIDTVRRHVHELAGGPQEDQTYNLCYDLAEDNLKLGHHVVVDCCNPVGQTRHTWQRIADRNGATLQNVQVTCTDQNEHKKRVEARRAEIDDPLYPTWQQTMAQEYEKWDMPTLTIDTSHKKVPSSVFELLSKLTWD